MMHPKILRHPKSKRQKPQSSRQQEILTNTAEINEMETEKSGQIINGAYLKNKIKSWCLKKMSKIGTFHQASQKKKREKHINNVRDLKGDVKTSEIQSIIRERFEVLHSKTMESLLKNW